MEITVSCREVAIREREKARVYSVVFSERKRRDLERERERPVK